MLLGVYKILHNSTTVHFAASARISIKQNNYYTTHNTIGKT